MLQACQELHSELSAVSSRILDVSRQCEQTCAELGIETRTRLEHEGHTYNQAIGVPTGEVDDVKCSLSFIGTVNLWSSMGISVFIPRDSLLTGDPHVSV